MLLAKMSRALWRARRGSESLAPVATTDYRSWWDRYCSATSMLGRATAVSSRSRLHSGNQGGTGIVEGSRGGVVHRVEVDQFGRPARVKVVDPSFFNGPEPWVALADTSVRDFALANKGFNLSHVGNYV
jgi:Ni,Fe-hydrogenase III large subunit